MKILALIPNSADGTSFFRAAGPLIDLEKQYKPFQWTLGADQVSFYDWQNIRRHDVFFAQRPCVPAHERAVMNAKESGIPVWVDLDDNLLEVPSDNPQYPTYSAPQNKMALIHCLQMADAITVTTPALQEVVQQYSNKVHVIPNAYDSTLFGSTPERRSKRNKVIVWRGGGSHVRDLMEIKDSIISIAKKYPDWMWVFIGYNPWFITDYIDKKQFKVFDFASNSKYMDTISRLDHAIQIVPLNNNPFNRCKSNIAWIETSYAGARVLAPNWSEWVRPGITNYSEPEEFEEDLECLMISPDTLSRQDQGFQYVLDNLTLQKINERRYKIISDLVGYSPA